MFALVVSLLVNLSCAKTNFEILGQPALKSHRRFHNTLSGLTQLPFQEGLISIPDNSQWAHDRPVSIAFRPPQTEDAPIFVLVHGASQDKTSFARVIHYLHEGDPDVGIGALDIMGAGETLERNLPLNYDLPIEANAIALMHFVRSINEKHPNNPIVLTGVSYGVGVILKAAKMDPSFRQVYSRAVGMAFSDRINGIEDAKMVKAHLMRLFWPYPGEDLQYFKDMAARELLFSQAFLSEPIVLKAPFPWTLESLLRLAQALDQEQVDSTFGEDLDLHSLDVMIAGDDQYLDYMDVAKFYSQWKATRTVMLLEKTEHKLNEANPAFTASWLLHLAKNSLHCGVYVGDPAKGKATSLSTSENNIQLDVEQRSFSANEVWRQNFQRAYHSWLDWQHAARYPAWSAANSIAFNVWADLWARSADGMMKSWFNPNPLGFGAEKMQAMTDLTQSIMSMQQNQYLKAMSTYATMVRGKRLEDAGQHAPTGCHSLFL